MPHLHGLEDLVLTFVSGYLKPMRLTISIRIHCYAAAVVMNTESQLGNTGTRISHLL